MDIGYATGKTIQISKIIIFIKYAGSKCIVLSLSVIPDGIRMRKDTKVGL